MFMAAGMTTCATRSYGTILGQPVALVATGIGEVNAGICTTEVLQCGPFIKDVIYSGTSGYSAQVVLKLASLPQKFQQDSFRPTISL